jgi:sulfate permease, SulP family
VLVFDTLPGLFIGIAVAFALLLYRTSRPNIAVLGRLPSGHWVDRERADAQVQPGVAVLRVEAGLFFANAEHVRGSILAHAREDGVKAVVLDAQTVPYVDVTAAEMLRRVRDDLARGGVRLVVARDIGQVRDVLQRAGAEDEAVVFPTVEDAVSRVR